MASPTSLAELEAEALAGDAPAQTLLGHVLLQAGRRDQAHAWLERAAATGYAAAQSLLARDLIEDENPRANAGRVMTLLQSAAAQGDPAATNALATMRAIGLDAPPDWSAAMSLFATSVATGDRAALRQLSLLLSLSGRDDGLSAGLLYEAAKKGDGLAAFAALRRHQRGKPLAREEELSLWQNGLKQRQHPLIDKIGAIDTSEAPAAPHNATPDARVLTDAPARPIPQRTVLSQSPAVWKIDGLFTEEECDYVVGSAAPRLAPAVVIHPATGAPMQRPERSSHNAMLRAYQADLVMHYVERRLAAAAAIPLENGEITSILRYRPGEEYRPHFDFLSDNVYGGAALQQSGQRVATLLVCLNDEFSGGETSFLTPGIKWKGRTGDALLFRNVTDDGKPDLTTRHAGQPVTSGEKWLLSKWYRANPYFY